MIVETSSEFDRWWERITKEGGRASVLTDAMVQGLTRLAGKPPFETATYKRIQQARRHELWRVAHPYEPSIAVRIVCYFPNDEAVVLALLGFNKARIGDVFYASAAARGEAMVDQYLRQQR